MRKPFVFLSDENPTDSNVGMQRLELSHSTIEGLEFRLQIGSQKDFDNKTEQWIQFSEDEMENMYNWLGEFYGTVAKQTVVKEIEALKQKFS